MFSPAFTGSGASDLVTIRLALVCTAVVVVAVLLAGTESPVVAIAVAVLLMLAPLAVLALTLTTIVKTAVSPAVTVAFEKTTLPTPPTAGATVPQPLPVVTVAETNVALAGTASVTATLVASLGPLLM